MAAFDNPLAPRTKDGYPEATRRLKESVRAILRIDESVAVSITELACYQPGCPGLETVIGILAEGRKPWIGRIHKRIPEIVGDDVEAAFLEHASGLKRREVS